MASFRFYVRTFFGTYGFVGLVCGSYMSCCFVCSPLEVGSSICIYKFFLHPSFGYHNRCSLMFKPSIDPWMFWVKGLFGDPYQVSLVYVLPSPRSIGSERTLRHYVLVNYQYSWVILAISLTKLPLEYFLLIKPFSKQDYFLKNIKILQMNLLGGHNVESKGRFYCPKFNCFKFKLKSKLVRLTKNLNVQILIREVMQLIHMPEIILCGFVGALNPYWCPNFI